MTNDFLDMITELLLAERLGEELQKDKQYKAAISEEERIYELLNNTLNEEQQTMLKSYFDAANTTSSLIESFVYKQGMKDLLSLFRSLSGDGECKFTKVLEEHGIE